jgi:hypothetical protein
MWCPRAASQGDEVDGIATTARSALEPFIGQTAADTCIRATALSLGKTADDLDGNDMPALIGHIRNLLKPVAPVATIDQIVSQIESSARAES